MFTARRAKNARFLVFCGMGDLADKEYDHDGGDDSRDGGAICEEGEAVTVDAGHLALQVVEVL